MLEVYLDGVLVSLVLNISGLMAIGNRLKKQYGTIKTIAFVATFIFSSWAYVAFHFYRINEKQKAKNESK